MENQLEKFGQNSFMYNVVKTDDILKDMCGIIQSSQKAAYQAVNTLLVQRNWLMRQLHAVLENIRARVISVIEEENVFVIYDEVDPDIRKKIKEKLLFEIAQMDDDERLIIKNNIRS